MKDKNGNEIKAGERCIVDEKQLGLVTGTKEDKVIVLMLKDAGQVCAEELISPEYIEMK